MTDETLTNAFLGVIACCSDAGNFSTLGLAAEGCAVKRTKLPEKPVLVTSSVAGKLVLITSCVVETLRNFWFPDSYRFCCSYLT